MATQVYATPRILTAEITMLARLSAMLRNYWRAMASRRSKPCARQREIEQAIVAQRTLARDAKRVIARQSASTGQPVSPSYAEFIRTQSQLTEVMLKAMILVSGGKVEGRPDERD